MQVKTLAWAVILIAVSLCAWSPWITPDIASQLAESQFDEAWNGVIDGCGTSGDQLGAKDFIKVPFGAYVTLDYQCGLVMPGEPALQTSAYVSIVGITFGFPRP